MKTIQQILLSAMFVAIVFVAALSAKEEIQATGTPGSPSATTTVDGGVINPSQHLWRRDSNTGTDRSGLL